MDRMLHGVNCTVAASPSQDLTSPCIVNITTPRLSLMLLQRCTTTNSSSPHARTLRVFKNRKVSTLPCTKTQIKFAKSTIHIKSFLLNSLPKKYVAPSTKGNSASCCHFSIPFLWRFVSVNPQV